MAKTELEDAGLETDGMAESTAKMREEMMALSGVDIMLDENTFKSTFQIFDELSNKWADLTDIQQASITELVAGKRQGNVVSSLMENFDIARRAAETARQAEGSAMKEHSKWSESIEFRLNRLQSAWEGLSRSFLSSDFLKGLIDSGRSLIEVLDVIIEKVGVIPTILTSITAFKSIKGNGLFKVNNGNINFGNFDFKNNISNLNKLSIAFDRYNKLSTKSVKFNETYNRALNNSNSSMTNYLSSLNGAKASLSGYAGHLMKSKVATIGLQVATTALNMAITMGLSMAITGAITGISNLIHKEEEQHNKLLELGETAKSDSQELISLYNSYQNANLGYVSNKVSKENLTNATNQLLEALGIEESAIGSLVEQYGSLDEAINQVTNNTLYEKLGDLKNSLNEQKKDILDEAINDFNGEQYSNINLENKILGKDAFADKNYGSFIESKEYDFLKKIGLNLKENNNLFGKTTSIDFDFGNIKSADDVINVYNELIDIRNKYQKEFKNEDLSNKNNFPFLNEIEQRINLLKNSDAGNIISEYEKTGKQINEISSQIQFNDYVSQNGLPETVEEFNKLRNAIIDVSKENENFIGTNEEITNSIDSFLDKQPQLRQFTDTYIRDLENREKTFDELRKKQSKPSELNINPDGSFSSNNKWVNWFDSLKDEDKELVYKISAKADDTTLWTLTKWKEELSSMAETGRTTGEQMQQFYDLMNDTEEGAFPEQINNYVSKINELKELLSKDLTDEDIVGLSTKFPELTPYLNDTDALRNAIQNLINTSNQDMNNQLNSMIEDFSKNAPLAAEALESLRDAINSINKTDIDLDEEIVRFDSLYNAMSESVSGKGMSKNAISQVKDMFSELESFDPEKLFERTYNGIHMNTKELRNLQSQYEKQKKTDISNNLKSLIEEYNNLSSEINNCSNANERISKLDQLDKIQKEISSTAELASQYAGLTSAYNQWIKAKESGEEGDMYDSIRSGYEETRKLYEEGLVGTNAFREYVDLLSGNDLSTAPIEDIVSAWENLSQTINGTSYTTLDFLEEGKQGSVNFLKAVEQLNSDWASMNSDGSWNINFGKGSDSDIANALGLDVEFVQASLRKLSEYGFDINLDSIFSEFDDLSGYIEESNKKLNDLGKTDIKFNVKTDDIEDITKQISQAQELLNTFKNTDGTVNTNLEGAEEAQNILISLITRKQELNKPAIMSIDTSSANQDIQDAIGLLRDFEVNYNNLEIQTAVGADTTTAQQNLKDIATKLDEIPTDTKVSLGIDSEEFNTAIDNLLTSNIDVKAGVNLDESSVSIVENKIHSIQPDVIAKLNSSEIDKYKPRDKNAKVNYKVNDYAVTQYTPPNKIGIVRYNAVMNPFSAPKMNGRVGKSNVDGYRNSFFGLSFANGHKNDLVGEVAPEMLVRNGQYYLIGEHSAEFIDKQKNDIIFDGQQTKELLETGRITKSRKRGKSYSHGTGSFWGGNGSSKNKKDKTSSSSSSSGNLKNNNSNNKSNNSNDNSNNEKEFSELIDWIIIKIDRIERAISQLGIKATSVFRSWGERSDSLKNQIHKVTEEINIQSQAYNRYKQQADSVDLSDYYKQLVRDGAIDIETITDENLAEKIKEYQEWHEKMLDCDDAMLDLKETESELYKQSFDNTITKFEGILSTFEHRSNMIDQFISQSEEHGYITSVKYYQAQIQNELNSTTKRKQEKDELINELNNAVSSGKIVKYSEAWYEMVNEINDVTMAIEESNTSVLEFQNSIREVEWGIFDLLQEQISQVTKESDFLISLMENDKLYDKKGQFTSDGMSTMGLHGQNYNIYMIQADKYGQEILKINKEIANDPANQDLIKRKQELLELQQDMILAAEDEKDAIVDMVREGIELELDSLQKLIDEYNKAIDSERELYEYNKKVKEQTKEISDLEKQMSAYQNDDSEETKSKIQELKVSLEEAKANLEETEYNKYITDQKQLLDDLYLQYEEILNSRLDNIDLLINDMIDNINSNSSLIYDNITIKTDEVGYKLSDINTSIWGLPNTITSGVDSITNVLTTYGKSLETGLINASTNISMIIKGMEITLNNSIKHLNDMSDDKINSIDNDTNNITSVVTPSISVSSNPVNTEYNNSNSNNGGDGMPNVGDKVIFDNGIYYQSPDGTGRTGRHRRGGYVYITAIETRYNAPYKYHISSGSSIGNGDLGWLRLDQLKGYKFGGNNIRSGLAWTQEDNKEEYIIRPSDGAVLTPIHNGDSVLNHAASKNLWDMSNNPSDFIRDNINTKINTANELKHIPTEYYQTIGQVVFDMKNVKNYEEMINSMKSDKNFEKLIMSMTLDRINGKSSLAKYKSIR